MTTPTPNREGYVLCEVCRTWRRPHDVKRDDSGPEGLAVERCKDEGWCERQAALVREVAP